MAGHLIHVGFPKAGSNTLAAWFEAHPQLEFAPGGLAGYHGAFEISSRAAAVTAADPPRWYVTSSESLSVPRLSDAPSLQDRADAVPGVPLAESRERSCRTLQALFPEATILIVTRGFRGALASSYSQYVRSGGRATIGDLFLPNTDYLADYLDFDAVVSLYSEAFGADRVIVLPYELLRDDAAGFARTLEERLGLAGGPPMPSLNRGLSPTRLLWYLRLSRILARVASAFDERLGSRLWARYVEAARADRLGAGFDSLQRIMPIRGALPEVPEEAVEACRGRASVLGEQPLYARYAGEYLNPETQPAFAEQPRGA